jgi:hypothetical protein
LDQNSFNENMLLSEYNDQTIDGKTRESGFNSQQEQEISLSSTILKPVQGPSQLPSSEYLRGGVDKAAIV